MMSPGRPGDRAMTLLLAALAMIGPFSIDTYLPSFPDLAASLAATPLEVQQSLSFYLAPYALMMLWHGALSDALGRRPVILAGLACYLLASAACIFATRIEELWLFRALQGLSAGVGLSIGRAVVRDLYEGAAAQRLLAHVNTVFALAPAVAPICGGFLQAAFGWRAVFVLLTVLATLLWFACWRLLPETLAPEKRQSLHPLSLLTAYRRVFTDARFLAATVAIACAFSGIFIYILSAPVFVMSHLGLGPTEFGWLFVPVTTGMMAGSALAARWAGHAPYRLLRRGFALMVLAAAANLFFCKLSPAFPWAMLALPLYTIGMAVVMPGLTLLALDRFPERRGMASSCQGFIHVGGNALAAGFLAPLVWGSTGALAATTATLLTGSMLAARLHRRLSRSA
jgi:DHA1 family bicyclomycin/chloramphenicol resistance-like MFS transporter